MSAATITLEDTQCTKIKEHPPTDHSLETVVHKCIGPECILCLSPDSRCQYKLMTFQVWVDVSAKTQIDEIVPHYHENGTIVRDCDACIKEDLVPK